MKKTIVILLLVIFCALAFAACATEAKPSPGIQGPEGWPEEVPTPLTGEFLWGDWTPDKSFYTVDIRYTQAEIDAYAKRLQDAGFKKKIPTNIRIFTVMPAFMQMTNGKSYWGMKE